MESGIWVLFLGSVAYMIAELIQLKKNFLVMQLSLEQPSVIKMVFDQDNRFVIKTVFYHQILISKLIGN